jgi:pimeloyl-ACP methyl ester carboxylesterase
VIAWDAPGCGGTDDPPSETGMADYADADADLITALDLPRVHLCGLSFGSGLALAVYRRDTHLVRYLAARNQQPADVCRDVVQAADVYVLIAGSRYGSPV